MSKAFSERVYNIVRRIPAGKIATYQDVARLAGSPGAARAVGLAMKNNPAPSTIPCHRVVGSDGSMHGYAFGGAAAKAQMLKREGVGFIGLRADLATCWWQG